jgi:glycosyltransferase involved in cell wall biosynthesis
MKRAIKLKIGLMGTRGIPACYSGFETFYEELSWRLAEKGHCVTVYNRSNYIKYKEPYYRRVRLVRLPTLKNKHLDTFFHTFLSVLHGIFQKYDIVYFCIVGNSPLTIIPRLFGAKTILNVDGADWEREKWKGFAKRYLLWSEKIATKFPDVVIADSRIIQKRYRELYNKNTVFLSYGANVIENSDQEYLEKYKLEKNKYILFVGRLVPENQAHLLIRVFNEIDTDMKLAIVGDAPYEKEYKKRLKQIADERVIFTGFVFGKGYQQLSSNAYLYVLTSGVEGTRPVLLDQMAFSNCVLVRNSAANMEVIGDSGWSFDGGREREDLIKQLQYLISHPEIVKEYRKRAQERVINNYSWEAVTDQYEKLFFNLKKNN